MYKIIGFRSFINEWPTKDLHKWRTCHTNTHFNAQLGHWHNRQCLANRRFKPLFVASVHLFLFRCLFWMKLTIAKWHKENVLWLLALPRVQRFVRSVGRIEVNGLLLTKYELIQSSRILTFFELHSRCESHTLSHVLHFVYDDPDQLKTLQINHKSFWKKLFFISSNQVAFIHNVSFLCSSIGE